MLRIDNNVMCKADTLIREYAENRKYVKAFERTRPSLIERAAICAQGYLAYDYEFPNGFILPSRDMKLLLEYIRRRRRKEIIDIAIDERMSGKCRDVFSDTVREGKSVADLMATYEISSATVTRMRKKGWNAVADEIEVWGMSSDFLHDD